MNSQVCWIVDIGLSHAL
jgi:hypothetical protein